jgi:hypothetical protein
VDDDSIDAKCPHPKVWFYPRNDAFMGLTCQVRRCGLMSYMHGSFCTVTLLMNVRVGINEVLHK